MSINLLTKIVQECIDEHEGGEKFFDALDENIKDKQIINILLSKIFEAKDNKKVFIVSGKFGQYFFEEYFTKFNVIVFEGGLRKGNQIAKLYTCNCDFDNKKVIFLDDSFYSGETRNRISEFLALHNTEIVHTYVVYDGSKIKQNNITSLYRYYKD